MSNKNSGPAAMERNDGLRRVLLRGSVYQAAQKAIGANKSSRRLANEALRTTTSDVVVDIGCGTADIVEFIEYASYVGFDPNPPYIAQAESRLRSREGDGVRLLVGAIGDPGLEALLPSQADLAMMLGVLHHLDDRLASEALALAARLIGNTGRFVSFDPALVPGQPRTARFLITRDRGQHVRTLEATRDLFSGHFNSVDIQVHHDLLNVPYTHFVVRASNSSPG